MRHWRGQWRFWGGFYVSGAVSDFSGCGYSGDAALTVLQYFRREAIAEARLRVLVAVDVHDLP